MLISNISKKHFSISSKFKGMIQDNMMRFNFVTVYYEGRSSKRTPLKIEFLLQKCLKISSCQFHVVTNGQGCGPPSPSGRVSIPSWAKSTFKLVSERKKKD